LTRRPKAAALDEKKKVKRREFCGEKLPTHGHVSSGARKATKKGIVASSIRFFLHWFFFFARFRHLIIYPQQ
jgi:hypothetical protein